MRIATPQSTPMEPRIRSFIGEILALGASPLSQGSHLPIDRFPIAPRPL
jgi:hypothetical protein